MKYHYRQYIPVFVKDFEPFECEFNEIDELLLQLKTWEDYKDLGEYEFYYSKFGEEYFLFVQYPKTDTSFVIGFTDYPMEKSTVDRIDIGF